jgi:hypothetical protein
VSWGRAGVRAAVVGAVLLILGSAASPAWAYRGDYQGRRHVPFDAQSGQPLYGCENALDHGPYGNLVKHTDPPEGAAVAPGQEITVELSWPVQDWDAPELHKVLDCVTVDGRLSYALTGGEKPTANDGHFSYHYAVPADAPPGTEICDVGFLSGPNGNEEFAPEESQLVCFTVERPRAAPALEAPPPAETLPRVEARAPEVETNTILPAPAPAQVLPRTGGEPGGARLGALSLALAGLASLARRRSR